MEIIIHPTIKINNISYNHIININQHLDIYIGNHESRNAEIFDYIIEICNKNSIYEPLNYDIKNILTLEFNDIRTNNILIYKDIIREFINNCKGKLLIHCGEGISRSPSILILYLIYTHNYTYNEAYNIISTKRFIKPNIGFIKQLKNL